MREECRVRPTLGRVGERERNGKEEGRKIERRGFGGMWPASDHVCWLD